MPERVHRYTVDVRWTGNRGAGTADYTAYDRSHEVSAAGKPVIAGSSDPTFRGDASRYNPEELLLASLSACHMLWYLHLCSDAGIVVTAYEDAAHGTMAESNGAGRFTSAVLRPLVTIDAGAGSNDDPARDAERLHARAHELCYIAASVNFPVSCEPRNRPE